MHQRCDIVLLADCPGCSVEQICSGPKTCSHSCGTLLTPSFPRHYANGIRCTWDIVVSKDSYVELTFKVFDVYEMDSPNCIYDRVSIYNTNAQSDNVLAAEDLIGSYCNTNQPPSRIESKWNGLFLEFTTDVADTGVGFWAMYKAKKYEAPSLATSNVTTGDILAQISHLYKYSKQDQRFLISFN